jgi:hypothetical protein
MVNNADFAIRLTSPKFLLPEADVRRLFLSGAVDVLEHSNVDLVLNPGKFEGDEAKPFTKVSQRTRAAVSASAAYRRLLSRCKAFVAKRCEYFWFLWNLTWECN